MSDQSSLSRRTLIKGVIAGSALVGTGLITGYTSETAYGKTSEDQQVKGDVLQRILDEKKMKVAVVIYPGRTFRAVTGAHGWVAGLYDGKIRVPAAGLRDAPPSAVRAVLTHEYAHALIRILDHMF